MVHLLDFHFPTLDLHPLTNTDAGLEHSASMEELQDVAAWLEERLAPEDGKKEKKKDEL